MPTHRNAPPNQPHPPPNANNAAHYSAHPATPRVQRGFDHPGTPTSPPTSSRRPNPSTAPYARSFSYFGPPAHQGVDIRSYKDLNHPNAIDIPRKEGHNEKIKRIEKEIEKKRREEWEQYYRDLAEWEEECRRMDEEKGDGGRRKGKKKNMVCKPSKPEGATEEEEMMFRMDK